MEMAFGNGLGNWDRLREKSRWPWKSELLLDGNRDGPREEAFFFFFFVLFCGDCLPDVWQISVSASPFSS
jgi:hypothetical protein